MRLPDRPTLRAVAALAFLVVGLALAGCGPSAPGEPPLCGPVDYDLADLPVPFVNERGAVVCDPGVTGVELVFHGPELYGQVFGSPTGPLVDGVPPADERPALVESDGCTVAADGSGFATTGDGYCRLVFDLDGDGATIGYLTSNLQPVELSSVVTVL